MKLYGAIDLHPNNNVTVVIDEQDRVVYQKRLPNDLPLITQQLSAYLNLRGSSWNRPSTGTGWSTVLWTRGTAFIWPTRLRSNNMKGSNTPKTISE
ncbi:MAG TPA: hypothetical protein VFS81_21500 [Candidatus Binatia bacterium]|nr:hypothetical protein [Candidatus Binatia bacterium]